VLNHCYSHKQKVLALMACLLVMISGCSAGTDIQKMPSIQPVVPPSQHHLRASLYFVQTDGTYLPEVRSIDLSAATSPEEALIRQLIAGPSGNLLPVIGKTAALNYVYIVGDTAYVDLTIPATQTTVRFSQACAQSLHDAFGISYLILTVDGRLPADAKTAITNPVQQKADTSVYLQLFFPDNRGQYIVGSVRRILKPADGDMDGPSQSNLMAAMGNDITLASMRKTGTRMDITLNGDPGGIHLYGYACIAMSVLRNVSKVQSVRIQIGGAWINDVPGLSGTGVFTVSSIKDIMGGLIQLYFASTDGKSLVPVKRSIPLKAAADPLQAVKEIIRGPLDVEKAGIRSVLPSGVEIGNALSLKRDESVTVLNLQPTFFKACASVSENTEKLLLYAFVNSLTERSDIQSVLFVSGGANVETLSGTISLYKPLLRNPGLIVQQ
jgi:hypothetical protein